jgi:hypothetical protein
MDKQFLKIVKQNAEEVKRWPKWMRKIRITAQTADTGEFIKEDKGGE